MLLQYQFVGPLPYVFLVITSNQLCINFYLYEDHF